MHISHTLNTYILMESLLGTAKPFVSMEWSDRGARLEVNHGYLLKMHSREDTIHSASLSTKYDLAKSLCILKLQFSCLLNLLFWPKQSDMGSNRRSSIQFHENPKAELPAETHKSEYLRIFSCRNEPATGVARQNGISKNETVKRDPYFHVSLTKLNRAITTICTSESLIDCETSIRTVARAWLDLHEDPNLEMELSKEPFIEGLLEVLFSSEDDEILELAISILAELVVRNEVNRQMILNSDPHLEIFLRLLRSNSLFLKAAVLLYLLKPKAKQMLSPDWIPLVLRVLEFGDRLQTLFTIQCNPQTAVFYLLDQLMNGFDIDRNLENAKQVVSLGGLRLLIQRFELGDSFEKRTAASFMSSCIQADGICRHYLANNIKRASILELLLGNHSKSGGCALSLLAELVCLHRYLLI